MTSDPPTAAPRVTTPGRRHEAVLAGVLLVAMFASTFPQFAIGVLGPILVDELSLGEVWLGVVAATLYLVAAVVARFGGRQIDGMGPRNTLLMLYVLAAGALSLLAASRSLIWLLAAGAVAGLAMGINNPVTNRLVALHAVPGRRGLVVGVKQSGVKVSQLAAGAVLPVLAATIGWRQGLLLVTGVVSLGAVAGRWGLPRQTGRVQGSSVTDADAREQVRWLRWFAMTMAVGVSAITTYLPLFAVERVGMGLTGAGAVVGTFAITATVARLAWAAAAERLGDPTLSLRVLSGLAALGLAVLASADTLGPAALWAGTVVTGATIGSWNVVAHVTVVSEVPAGHAASASGFVQSAFFLGLGLGAPLFGGFVQFMGGFSVAWGATILLTLWAFALASFERRRRDRTGAFARSKGARSGTAHARSG